MKKMKFYVLVVTILSLLLVGCVNGELASTSKEVSDVMSLSTDQNVLVFSTLSSATALGGNVTNSLSKDAPVFGGSEVEIDMDKANSYLLMMENMLAEGGPVVSTEGASDREGYDLMMTITVKDLAGNTSVYTIYYSIVVDEADVPTEEVLPEETPSEEVPTEEETATLKGGCGYHEDHNDRERDDEDKNHDNKNYEKYHDKAHDQFKHHNHFDKEDEVEYEINALAVIDGVEYEVFGKKEVETEEDGEVIEIKFTIKLDENNYVSVEQEIEEDEVEYKYTIFQNGRKASSLTFNSEEEDGNTFVKLTTTNDKGEKETYKFYKSADVTIVKYETKGYKYTLVVTASEDSEGNIVYDYKVREKEGFKWNHKKGHKDERPNDQVVEDEVTEDVIVEEETTTETTDQVL